MLLLPSQVKLWDVEPGQIERKTEFEAEAWVVLHRCALKNNGVRRYHHRRPFHHMGTWFPSDEQDLGFASQKQGILPDCILSVDTEQWHLLAGGDSVLAAAPDAQVPGPSMPTLHIKQ